MKLVSFSLVLLACGGEAEKSTNTDPAGDDRVTEPSPYVVPDEDAPTATLSGEDVGEIIQSSLGLVSGVSVEPAWNAYQEAMTGADGDCPAWYADDYGSYWYDYCYASTGATFEGYGYQYLTESTDEYGTAWIEHQLYTEALIESGSHTFEASGGLYGSLGLTTDGGTYTYGVMYGSFSWDGSTASGTWLEDGTTPQMEYSTSIYPEWAAGSLYLDGVLDSGEGPIVAFSVVELSVASWGFSCEAEPAGTIAIRADEGGWYDVIFDSSWEEPTAAEDCDGCGAVWFRGEYIGEACADFSPWMDIVTGRAG